MHAARRSVPRVEEAANPVSGRPPGKAIRQDHPAAGDRGHWPTMSECRSAESNMNPNNNRTRQPGRRYPIKLTEEACADATMFFYFLCANCAGKSRAFTRVTFLLLAG